MIESLADRRSLLADDGVTAVFGEIVQAVGFPYVFPIIFGQTNQLAAEREVVGLFGKAYLESHGVEGYRPVFLILDEDAQHIRHTHKLALYGTVYEIVRRKPDGEGFTSLGLNELGTYESAIDPRRYPYTMADYLRKAGTETL